MIGLLWTFPPSFFGWMTVLIPTLKIICARVDGMAALEESKKEFSEVISIAAGVSLWIRIALSNTLELAGRRLFLNSRSFCVSPV